MREDPEQGKTATTVPLAEGKNVLSDTPAPLLILYSCPDAAQERSSSVRGVMDGGETDSPSHGFVTWSWQALAGLMPFPIEEVVFGVALGCRPVSFTDPRKLMKAKGEFIKGCRRRWQVEILLADPDLVLVCGRHALAAVRPDLGTQHSRLVGEVIQIPVPTPRGTVVYEGFVTTSPDEVVLDARDDHYEVHDWQVAPEQSHVDNPVRHWLWYLLYACWLAQTLRDVAEGRPPRAEWPSLLSEIDRFHASRTTVASLLERKSALFSHINQLAQDELSGKGARQQQQTEENDEDE
jgi:hypothetical protein